LVNQINPIYNCVITNVPGPQVPLYNTGARMLSNFGTGPVADGVGLFQVISSYCGGFSISATCCREMMPDPEFYQQCLRESFEELKAGTVGNQRRTPKKAAAQKRTPDKRKKSTAGNKTRAGGKATPKARPKSAGTKSRPKQKVA